MQSTQPSVAVIGGGSFGTAVVKMVSENLGSCHWWMHNEESAAHIREYHHNPRYLSVNCLLNLCHKIELWRQFYS